MDPITLAITTALTNLSQEVIKDTYMALKAALLSKYGVNSEVAEAVDKLEEKPDAKARQDVLQEEIANSGADKDRELLQIANALIEELKKLPSGKVDINQDIAISGSHNIVVGQGNVTINPLPPAETRLRHDLKILLENVQNTWIKGVLEKSIYEVVLLDLGMELRGEVVDNPWRFVIEGLDRQRETIPRGKKIKDIFDEANRLLLILGKPGSGKTTTLLQLARDLIADIDQSFTQPVPIILNLSTWTSKQTALDAWLVAELNNKYRLPKKDGQRWLEERRVLPLLDGLDEVRVDNRAACVEKINQLVSKYGLEGLAVCSRIKEYTDLNVRLALHRAIYIQPLSTEQVVEYLDQAGDKLISLRATLQGDPALQSMAQSPLFLNVMSLAYRDRSAESLSNPALANNKARRKHLFDAYMARMFNRRANTRTFRDEQTKHYLSWLAQNMERHNQEVFLIEGLQPSWLSSRSWRMLYIVISRFLCGVLLAFGSYISFPRFVQQSSAYLLILPLCVGVIEIVRSEWLAQRANHRIPASWRSAINALIVGAIMGLISGLIEGWEYLPYDAPIDLLYDESSIIMITGLAFGLTFGLRGAKQGAEMDIETVEALRWSWPEALRGGTFGGLIGLIVGLIYGSFGAVQTISGDLLLEFGISYMIIFAIIGFIHNGLRSKITKTKSLPNEGIRLSMRNAILGGLMFGLGSASAVGSHTWPYGSLTEVIRFALGFGLMGTLWYGGFDVIQHYVLRLFLVVQGYTPANYSRFLDYAVDRIFLQKVGGNYRFIHRLLLQHFAEINRVK